MKTPAHSLAGGAPSRLAALVALLAAPGCRCSEDRPYVPFHIDPTPSVAPSASAAPSSSAGATAAFSPRAAVPAPPNARTFTLDGVTMGVDAARVMDRAVTGDFDGDGATDAVALTRDAAAQEGSFAGAEIVAFDARSPAGRVLAATPPFVPTGPGCRHAVGLTATGPHTVTLDVAARCEAQLVPRSPARGLVVLAPATERPVVLALRVADPAPGETLDATVDTRDQDGDGRDDVRVTWTLRVEGGTEEASADLAWLDRAAGPARETREPSRSLAAIASIELVRAPGKTTSARVPGRVDAARRLYSSLCAESEASRVFDADGAPLACSDVGAALADLVVAEVRAALARKDLLSAVGALGRAGWFHAAPPEKTLAALEREVTAATTRVEPEERAVSPVPRDPGHMPHFAPLAFEADGALLVQTAEGVARVRMPAGDVEDAADSVEPWPLAVGGQDSPRWTGAAFSCDRSETLLLLSDAQGTPAPSRPTPVLAPRPGPCRRGATVPEPALVPLEWTAARQAGLIAGAPFGVTDPATLDAAPARGAPRSPDGKALAIASRPGVLVLGAGKPALWTVADAAGLSDCVPANGATRLACIRAGRVAVLTPGATKAR